VDRGLSKKVVLFAMHFDCSVTGYIRKEKCREGS
jgi:hypothetical protein